MNNQPTSNSETQCSTEKTPLKDYTNGKLQFDEVPLAPTYSGPANETPYQVKVVPQAVQDPPLSNVYLAIVTMLFCCMPCGLVALLRAIQAMKAYYRGELLSAEASNKSSKKWSIVSIVCGVITVVSIFFFVFAVNALALGLSLGLAHNTTCVKDDCM